MTAQKPGSGNYCTRVAVVIIFIFVMLVYLLYYLSRIGIIDKLLQFLS